MHEFCVCMDRTTHLYQMSIQNPNAPSYSIWHIIVLCIIALIGLLNQALQIIQPSKLLWKKNLLFTMVTIKGGSLKIIMDANEELPCGKRRLLWTFTNLCCNHYNGREEACSFFNTQRWKYGNIKLGNLIQILWFSLWKSESPVCTTSCPLSIFCALSLSVPRLSLVSGVYMQETDA